MECKPSSRFGWAPIGLDLWFWHYEELPAWHTGTMAQWCPICGECTCIALCDDDGPFTPGEDPNCRIHGDDSEHWRVVNEDDFLYELDGTPIPLCRDCKQHTGQRHYLDCAKNREADPFP